MVWSYSWLKMYETCARQYHEIKILKNFERENNEQSLYGNDLHKAADELVKRQKPLPEQFAFLQPLIDALMRKPGVKFSELKLALTADLKPCDWMAPDVWVRGIIDFMVLDEEYAQAWIVDYKTGKPKYADKDQLDLMSLLVFAYYPKVVQVHSALAFVVKDIFIKHKRHREESEKMWWDYRNRVAKIEKAQSVNVWNPTRSGLCKSHCVVRSCEHNGRM